MKQIIFIAFSQAIPVTSYFYLTEDQSKLNDDLYFLKSGKTAQILDSSLFIYDKAHGFGLIKIWKKDNHADAKACDSSFRRCRVSGMIECCVIF